MSLACEPNKPSPTYLEILTQKTNRDIGLSPVFNVNTEVVTCLENFVNPSYPCGNGMCEPLTGLTIGCPSGYVLTSGGTICVSGGTTATTITVDPGCLYNLSIIDDFDITFDFSSGSTMYTGYTGEFCYAMVNSLPATPIPSVCTPYSGITGNTITRNFSVNTDISTVDNTYRVRSWDVFTSKCMTDEFGMTGTTGTTIDNSLYIDTDNDCYFATVTNPPKPSLDHIPANFFEGIQFINETINIVENQNQFLLNSKPLGNAIVLTVNGLTVSGEDYTIDTIDTRLITIVTGITMESTDVLSASYNTSSSSDISEVNVRLEIFSVTGVTTGVTSSFTATTYENIVNYNSVNNRTEIYLKDKIDQSVQPRLTVNGVTLSYNVDFFKSNIVDNKLILNEGSVIEVGDVISVYYYYSGLNNPGDLGKIRTNTPTIKWSEEQNIMKTILSNGIFTLEVTNRNDPTFSNILKTGTTLYNNSVTSYTLDVEPITTTSIKDYIYRIKFVKNFVASNPNNIYTTESYSDTGSFRLDWSYINNTNF
jgi:hypothetical protein